MPDPLAFARALIEAGVPVLACPPGGTVDGYKLPLDWQAAKADPRALDAWRPGRALIAVCGVQPGGGVDVIDLDPRNSGDLATITAQLPPVVAMVATPGDDEHGTGLHLYVPAQGLGKGVLGPGIDYQAGTGTTGPGLKSDRGFVWLPGTERESKAGRPGYEVLAGLEAWPLGGAQDPGFIQWVTEARARAKPATGPDKGPLSGPVLKGGRDRDATSVAASMRRRGFSLAEAEAALTARWTTYEQPAGDHYPLEAALAKLDTAWRAFEPREVPLALEGFSVPQRHLVAVPDHVDGPEGFVRPEPVGLTFVDWEELEAGGRPAVEWLVPGIMAKGRGHLLYSTTGQGKSLLTLEWAATLAKAGTRVLYVDWENDPEGDTWVRLLDMGLKAADLANLRYLSFPTLAPLDVSGAQLVAAAVDEAVEFVILDTASRTVQGEESSADTWAAWDRVTGVPLRRAGIGFLRLDHAGKDVERGARGSSGKVTDVDLAWRLELVAGSNPPEVILTNEKARVAVPDKTIVLRRMSNPLRHERLEAAAMDATMAKKRVVFEFLQDSDVPLDEGRDKIKARLEKAGIQISNGALGDVIKVRKQLAAHELELPPTWVTARAEEGCWTFGGAVPGPSEGFRLTTG